MQTDFSGIIYLAPPFHSSPRTTRTYVNIYCLDVITIAVQNEIYEPGTP